MIELKGTQSATSIDNVRWRLLLDLGKEHGWRPAGTHNPASPGVLPGGELVIDTGGPELSPEQIEHLTAMVQSQMPRDPDLYPYFVSATEVSAEDAEELSNALSRALAFLPAHDAMVAKAVMIPGIGHLGVDMASVRPAEFFSGPRRQQVHDFIRFCRQGKFTIADVTF